LPPADLKFLFGEQPILIGVNIGKCLRRAPEFSPVKSSVAVTVCVGDNLAGGEPTGANKFGGWLIGALGAAPKFPAIAFASGRDSNAGLAPLFGDQTAFLAAGEKLGELIAK
jgi:hypothetical protein